MNLDLFYAILIALLFICVFVLFSNFSIMNTIIVSIVFYMIYNVIFTDDYEDGVVLGGNHTENKSSSNHTADKLGGNHTADKLGGNEANHIDDLKESEDNLEMNEMLLKVEPILTKKPITKKNKVNKKQKTKTKHISSK